MSNFNALMRGEKLLPAKEPVIDTSPSNFFTGNGGSEEVINLKYIIENKPKAKIVREFMRANLAGILSAEQELFQL